MNIRLARGIFPCLVQYTDNLPAGVGGRAWKGLPFLQIRPKYADDVGLHEHEFTHVQQFYWLMMLALFVGIALAPVASVMLIAVSVGVIAHPMAYTLIAWYRLRAEVEAYREQLEHYPDDSPNQHAGREELFAWYVADKYGLDIAQPDALRMLRA